MSLPIYQRVAVTDAGDVIPGAEYTVINENTGVAQPIYSDRTGLTLKSAPYFADSVGTIQFFIAQGTTFRVAASGGVGTYTDRYVYGVAEAVLVQADGNVGIGTNSPLQSLHVNSGTSNSAAIFESTDSTSQIWLKDSASSSTYQTGIACFGDNLLFNNGGEKVRINSAGNVGIGTTIINSSLSVGSSDAAAVITSGGSNTHLSMKAMGSQGVLIFGAGGVANGTPGIERMRIDSAGHLLVGKTATGDFTPGFEVQQVGTMLAYRTNGLAGIFGRSNNGELIRFNENVTQVGSISITGNSTAYNTSSDYRLKEDDVAMTDATERVKALRPINFAWKASGSRVDGFFAHELAEVVPEAATGTKDGMRDEEYEVTPAVYKDVTIPAVEAVLDEDGVVITEAVEESTESVLVTEAVMATRSVPDYQGIDQSKLVPLLTATIQELIARIEALEAGA